MKKITSIFLIALMSVSLVACGSSNGESKQENQEVSEKTTEEKKELSKEDLLKEAKEVASSDMNNDFFENKVAAKQTYCNTPIKTKAYVWVIEDEYAILTTSKGSQVCIDVYLPIEELAKLETTTYITVVGTISDIQDYPTDWGGTQITYPHYIMDVAYLVE